MVSCASPGPDESPFDVRVRWGLTGSSVLPSSVATIDVLTCTLDPGTGEETCESTNCSVAGLTGMSEVATCRPPIGTEMWGDAPVLVRRDLATDTPIRFRFFGLDATNLTTHVGVAGPFVLGTGERRLVDVTMYPVGMAAPFPGESIRRIFHTTSLLPDGRLLVAGGFDTVTTLTCPVEMALAPGSRCWALTSTDAALAIEIGSGRIEPIRSPMLAARGGHTATTLPDGRILIAGGAARAVFALVPTGGMTSGRYVPALVPLNADGTAGAHDSFEIFDAFLGHQTDDPDRDGDPGRGGFFGTNGTSSPGAMNTARFLHAAAAVPSTPGRVVLVGGMGAADSATTWEVFDSQRPGGPGFHRAGANTLLHARPAPGAVGLQGQVWVFGGRLAEDNDQLAEVWETSPADPNGTIELATDGREFPSSAPATLQDHPEYALIRPMVASVESGSRAVVLGWLGAQCDVGMNTPRFFSTGAPGEYCNAPTSPVTRSFTVNASTGITTPTEVRSNSFGALGEFTDFEGAPSSRRIVVTGGIANGTWTAQPGADIFTGGVDASGAATKLLGAGVSLGSGRFFHTSTGFPGQGFVTVGGATFDSLSGNLRLVDVVEAFFRVE